MAKSIPDIKFELKQVYKTYVEQLLLAGNLSDFLLNSANIDSSGEQIEGSLRILLRDLLPERVSITHGHIVDKNSNISYQQDILIAESFYTRSLIKSLDKTEFYPIEAIFSFGEVKKTWSQSKILSLIKSIKRNKLDLKRFEVPSDFLPTGSNFLQLSEKLSHNAFRNPLFSFSFSLDYDKNYSKKKIIEIYTKTENQFLPNVSVILKRGIIVCIDESKLQTGDFSIQLYPEFNGSKSKCRWVLLELPPEECFAYLIFMLTQHINDTILEKVSAMEYAKSMIEISKSQISPL